MTWVNRGNDASGTPGGTQANAGIAGGHQFPESSNTS
jgi:hypothetical protein